jgi:hypothetical protein
MLGKLSRLIKVLSRMKPKAIQEGWRLGRLTQGLETKKARLEQQISRDRSKHVPKREGRIEYISCSSRTVQGGAPGLRR